MLLGITIAIAAGLNPYVATLVVAALTGLASRVELTGPFADVDPVAWRAMIGAAALLAAVDLTLGKLRHRFVLMRWASLATSVTSGAAGAVVGVGDGADPLIAAASGAIGATVTSLAVTRVARATMDARAWMRLGHIPVMMGATVIAAIIVPLTLVFGWPGTALAGVVAAGFVVSATQVRRAPAPTSTGT